MYTREDLVKFGSYLLSEERAKKVEAAYPYDAAFAANARVITEEDFLSVWPIENHELTQADIEANGSITDETGVELKAGDVVGIPTDPNDLVSEVEASQA